MSRPSHCVRADGLEKNYWFSLGKAKQAARFIQGRAGTPFHPYKCPSCGLYHIASGRKDDRGAA